MYICPSYRGKTVEYSNMFPDIVLIDWQLRLLSFLTDAGHSVLTKQHPESEIRMPKYFFDTIGATDIVGNFENVYKQADIILTDYPSSTTFGQALKTSKPVIFIDFGFHKLPTKERNMLKKRCFIINGHQCDNNQIKIDWNDLLLGIETSFLLKGEEYVKNVL